MSLQTAFEDYQAGRYDAAETKLAALAMREPDNSQCLHLAAMVAGKRGDYVTALKRIQSSLHNPEAAHEKLNTRGNILASLGMEVDAVASFEMALGQDRKYHVARRNLAALLLDTAQPDKAAEVFADLIRAHPSDEAAHRGRVHALIEANELHDAEVALKKAPLEEAEKSAFRTRLHFYRGEFESVLGEAARALGREENGAGPFAQSLQVLRMTGGWEMADSLIEDTLARHPARADLWATGITALHKAGETDTALQIYGRSPRELPTLLARAEIALDQDHFTDAEALSLQALEAQAGNPGAMRLAALASLGLEKWDQAQSISGFGLQNDPNNQFYWAVKATAGRAKGQDYGYYFNYADFVKPYDLKAPEGWKDMSVFNADLKAELDALHGFSGAPLDQTLRLGTQTAPDLRFVDSPAIKGFFAAVAPAVQSYIDGLPRNPKHAFLRRNTGAFRVRSAWSVRLGAGGHHVDHIHPEGWISSAYYVDVPKRKGKEGWIKFGEPPIAIGQGPEHEVEPKAGRLVLFPSYLWHGTYPITGEATRMTLPIDILPGRPQKPA